MHKLIFTLFLIISAHLSVAQLKIGQTAPEIKLPDSLGKWKPLSEVKAKIILLDFWAVWCYPCMQSMPDLVALYDKYKEKGLEIYAVSLDKDYYHWIDGCRRKNLTFTLVNDPYAFNGKACKEYQVTAIPTKFLIKDNKIIGADMSLTNLEKLIQQELN